MTEYSAAEIVRFRPDAGTRERLLALRAQMIAEYERHWPNKFRAELYELEDGGWLDVWAWETRELAEQALAREDLTPTFTAWKELTGPVEFEWAARPAADAR